MALIRCPDCKMQISDTSTECKFCGCCDLHPKLPEKISKKALLFYILFPIVFSNIILNNNASIDNNSLSVNSNVLHQTIEGNKTPKEDTNDDAKKISEIDVNETIFNPKWYRKVSVDELAELITHIDNINISNEKGITPLMYAVSYSNSEIVKYLIDNKADVNAKNNMGTTVLMFACSYSQDSKIIDLLIDNGADINIENSNGKTALDYIKNNTKLNQTDIIKKFSTTETVNESEKMSETKVISEIQQNTDSVAISKTEQLPESVVIPEEQSSETEQYIEIDDTQTEQQELSTNDYEDIGL